MCGGRRRWVWGLLCMTAAGPAVAGDWPTYQADHARSGVTAQRLTLPLGRQWVFASPHPPAAGWAEPAGGEIWSYGIRRERKVRYDDCFPAVAAGSAVFLCSSAENKVHCLDAGTGAVRWSACTDAPPRLAPTVWRGKVYVGADDGVVRCLAAADGRPIWSFRAAPSRRKVLGQGRIMSLWPVRTGVLVDGGVAYFGAGLFPAEGLYLYALDAETGRRIWVNGRYGRAGRGRLTPQGYLLATARQLILPSGRICPGVFDRGDGRLLYEVPGGRTPTGGTYAMVAGERLINGTGVLTGYNLARVAKDKYGRDVHGPADFEYFGARRMVVGGGVAYLATGRELLAMPADQLAAAAKRADAVRKARWDGRHAVSSYERLRNELAAVDPNSPRRDKLAGELARIAPKYEVVAAAAQQADRFLDGVCKWRLAWGSSAHGENGDRHVRFASEPVPVFGTASLILAGGLLIAGGESGVIAVDAATGKRKWSSKVRGTARALAVAKGRLLVSTTTGDVYCFAPGSAARTADRPKRPKTALPNMEDDWGRTCREAVGRILGDRQRVRGYCLVVGCRDGRLACELARRTELSVYVVESDAGRVRRARELLSRAGLYGPLVAVEQGSLAAGQYPPYFANLIVCANSLEAGRPTTPARQLVPLLRPHGGRLWFYRGAVPGETEADLRRRLASMEEWSRQLRAAGLRIWGEGWRSATRGALPGAGQWSHQYADASNTACSGDALTRGPFGVLWFGGPGPRRMIDRHARGPSPLCVGGRLFIPGRDVVLAYDAYNGVPLWQREIAGARREHVTVDASNFAAAGESVFVVAGDRCVRLDAATGRTRQAYPLPARADGARRRWGWLAVSGEAVYGSRSETDRPFRSWPKISGNTSECVFALGRATGRVRWTYEGKGILHPSICVGGGRAFLVDRAVTGEQREQGIRERIRDADEAAAPAADRRGRPAERDVRLVVALDEKTGRKRWVRPLDVTDCVVAPGKSAGAGGELSLMYKDNVLLLCSAPWNGHFLKEWQAGRFSRRSIIALAGDTGKLLWSGRKGYRSRPLIVGRSVFAEPWRHDLRTGRPVEADHPITGRPMRWTMWRGYGGCGAVAASAGSLWFRAGAVGYWDLSADQGISTFGGHRPNCWINFIPAGGIVVIPEGSSGCDCAYGIQGTVALAPRPGGAVWAEHSLPKPLVPVRHLALNLGAPGDRRSGDGRLWVHYPNRVHKYHWVGSSVTKAAGAGFYHDESATARIGGTDRPWVFASGCRGLRRLALPVQQKGSAAARFTVRLLFCEPDELAAGRRVFDVRVQGTDVLKGFDVVAEAGRPLRAAVKQIEGVEAGQTVTVELIARGGAGAKPPVLSGVEILRETPDR